MLFAISHRRLLSGRFTDSYTYAQNRIDSDPHKLVYSQKLKIRIFCEGEMDGFCS